MDTVITILGRVCLPLVGWTIMFMAHVACYDAVETIPKPEYSPRTLITTLFVVYACWLVHPLFPEILTNAIGQLTASSILLYAIIKADGETTLFFTMGWVILYCTGSSSFGATAGTLVQCTTRHLARHAAIINKMEKQQI